MRHELHDKLGSIKAVAKYLEENPDWKSERSPVRYRPKVQTGKGKPGTELTKSLAWIEKIKPANATCSCKTLASEMDTDGVAKCRNRRDSYYLPKMLENKTAITDAMKAEGGLIGVAGMVGGAIPDALALPWLRTKFNAACDAAEKAKPARPQRRNRMQKQKVSNSPTIPEAPIPFTADPRLTLLFHVWPHGDGWRRHLDKLQPILHRFDRLILGIATDRTTATVDEVRKAFGDRWEVVAVENDPSKKTGLREVATYRQMLPMLSDGVNDITFCAHSKGTQGHTADSEPVTWWTDAMYETILYNIDGVIDEMRHGAAIVGSFRRHGKQLGTKHRWHYSGTFYAFRNSVALSNGVPSYQSKWWGTESWPGDHFPLGASACVFGDHSGHLYHAHEQRRAELEQWKASREYA